MNRDRIMMEYYPDKVDCREFIREIRGHLDLFVENIEELRLGKEEKYVEDWMDIFARWMEMK